jgi:predicted RecB family endonuclease
MNKLNSKLKIKPLILMCFLLLSGGILLAAENKLEEPRTTIVNVAGEQEQKNIEAIKKTQTAQNKAKQSAKKTVKTNKKDSFIPTEAISEDLAVSFPTDI